ncbi:unnamed protein product [Staurois parvus]|uniref:Uncharacterized protein n=1 Tax=Staurois parvus TaxID=386267 RepID=A0ABN9G8V0_9NEOB|nr:unnamed protein product [Staurois parvus]
MATGAPLSPIAWGPHELSVHPWRHLFTSSQRRTDHLETRALPEGPGSVGGPMRCPWYLFHRLF